MKCFSFLDPDRDSSLGSLCFRAMSGVSSRARDSALVFLCCWALWRVSSKSFGVWFWFIIFRIRKFGPAWIFGLTETQARPQLDFYTFLNHFLDCKLDVISIGILYRHPTFQSRHPPNSIAAPPSPTIVFSTELTPAINKIGSRRLSTIYQIADKDYGFIRVFIFQDVSF